METGDPSSLRTVDLVRAALGLMRRAAAVGVPEMMVEPLSMPQSQDGDSTSTELSVLESENFMLAILACGAKLILATLGANADVLEAIERLAKASQLVRFTMVVLDSICFEKR